MGFQALWKRYESVVARCCGAIFQVRSQSGIGRVYIAPLHASCHKGAIGVFDYFVCELVCAFGVGGLHFLQAFNRLVCLSSFCIVGNKVVILVAQVVANDDANIFKFEALRRMNASCFVY